MDYEKAYKEALERAKSFQEKYGGDYAGYIFPELRESEDERIRKELVAFFIEVRNREGNEGYWHDLKVADILAYLEKQKEQKPAEWSEDDKMNLNGCICSLHQYGYMTYADFLRHLPERFNLQPEPEWSKDDKQTINDACCWLAEYAGFTLQDNKEKGTMIYKLVQKLKSLRPFWKPSEEEGGPFEGPFQED